MMNVNDHPCGNFIPGEFFMEKDRELHEARNMDPETLRVVAKA